MQSQLSQFQWVCWEEGDLDIPQFNRYLVHTKPPMMGLFFIQIFSNLAVHLVPLKRINVGV